MNIERKESKTHKAAEKAHKYAQDNGDISAYLYAASLYEACGDYVKAAECRNAAAKLWERV